MDYWSEPAETNVNVSVFKFKLRRHNVHSKKPTTHVTFTRRKFGRVVQAFTNSNLGQGSDFGPSYTLGA